MLVALPNFHLQYNKNKHIEEDEEEGRRRKREKERGRNSPSGVNTAEFFTLKVS